MKSQLLLSVLMVVAIIGVYGQRPTMTLTFAADENGQHVPLNSILIENLTREVDTTLYAPDTVLVIDYLVGINENLNIGGDGFYLSQNYPNPFGGETSIDLLLPETENVLIVVSDILGRELVNRNYRLERGKHSFTFYPGTESLYFLTVRTDRHSQTIKMINTPAQSLSPTNCALEYNGAKTGFEQYKLGNDETNFVFYLGDLLKFTAFTDFGERVISSSPKGDRTYHFNFTGTSCPGIPSVTDIDGNVYNTVLIGEQCWMKESLKVGTMISGDEEMANNGIIEKYCYDNNEANCDFYGGLYQWNEMMGYTTRPSVQGICPDGWHVPSDAEWAQLIDYVVAQGFPNQSGNPKGAGNAIKSCRQVDSPMGGECNTTIHPRWNLHDLHHGFDEIGFTAFPGGFRHTNGWFSRVGINCNFWTSTEFSSTYVWVQGMVNYGGAVSSGFNHKTHGFTVRCIRDKK